MSKKGTRTITIILGAFALASVFRMAFTIVEQAEQIERLESELQAQKAKYDIIVNDPLYKILMETGG